MNLERLVYEELSDQYFQIEKRLAQKKEIEAKIEEVKKASEEQVETGVISGFLILFDCRSFTLKEHRICFQELQVGANIFLVNIITCHSARGDHKISRTNYSKPSGHHKRES
mgnify:FL=1